MFADASLKNKNVDKIEVGFASRIDLVGARNAKMLAKLKNLVRVT